VRDLIKKLLLATLVMSFFVVGAQSLNGFSNVTVSEAKTLIDTNVEVVILDVRTPEEHDAGHLRNAKLIPDTELESRLAELNVSDEILVYCRTGGRSAGASQVLADNGFLYVFNMLGGIVAWEAAGYPTYVKYPSIQSAIDNAAEGDTIFVSAGLYYEHLEVNKSISLIGENQRSTIIDGTSNGTIFKVSADNVSVAHFTMRYCGCVCEGYYGVKVEENCKNVSIRNNNITLNGLGIRMDWTHSAFIIDNNITRNNSLGISIANSSDIWMLRNHVLENLGGIKVENSSNLFVQANNIHDSLTGIAMADTNQGVLAGNTLSSNRFGGMYIVKSNNHSIFHNNFVQTGPQVYSLNSRNSWDNGLEGNYWSNYVGVDADHDGIGDTPFSIDVNNTDQYPLMGSFHSFNTSLGHPVTLVSNSTVVNFDPCQPCGLVRLHVSNMTANQTSGFVRMIIPKSFLLPPFTVTINGGLTEVLFLNGTLHGNDTHTWIYFAYDHSLHEIEITPEYPFLLILPLLMASTLLAAVLYRRGAASKP
jgi:parallel beta-helix repeat protein